MRAPLDHGAAVNRAAAIGSATAYSPLRAACLFRKEGEAEAVDLLLRAGAEETELVFRDGVQQSLAQEHDAGFRIAAFRAPPEEIERARTLLARAPNDRAWRRRRWLVMLRSRGAPRARRLRLEEATGTHGCCGRHGKLKAARAEHAGGGLNRRSRLWLKL